jgi:hypothetical protein
VGLYLQGWTVEASGPELRACASTVRRALLKAEVEIRRKGRKIRPGAASGAGMWPEWASPRYWLVRRKPDPELGRLDPES